MKLQSGTLPWLDVLQSVRSYPPLEQHLSCDVVVLGGGMSGALMAFELGKRGKNVVLLEKRSIAGGSTSASTGLLQFCNDKSLTSCIHTFGAASGIQFYTLCKQAVEKLLSLPKQLNADPDLLPRSSLYFASCNEDVPQLENEYATLLEHGFDVEWWDTDKIEAHFGFRKPAAIVTHGDAEANPVKCVHALIDTAVERFGLRIYEDSRVQRHECMVDGVACYTDKGFKVTARHAVFALGYETQELKRDRNAVLESTFAIATQPIPNLEQHWHQKWLIWETARPYLYLRTTTDNRIVAGGLDEGTTIPEEREAMLRNKANLLRGEINKLFPALGPFETEYAWTAAFGSTHDGYPLIGPHPDYPNCYFVEGYGGNGTVYSAIASELICDMIEYGSHPDEHLFRFSRATKP
ncbi:NAD(P)/FAD-dependent oxidoreductase [Paenibacillus sp. 481]|uniref:NAD(P)/FAD-dependent oxidoreductase n=1 Tax=Paenibacillus sp. 481 TaxID=2835869 RepID=UPI001E57451D|nr:FAD-dependent oxidoreductase [Paenibacillus sp. 481]UHA72326.1 FAD-binding oxidoreductase [Paenibacillus sp. 481]